MFILFNPLHDKMWVMIAVLWYNLSDIDHTK